MRIIKTVMVFGMALFLTLAALGNITMSDGAFGAVSTAVNMQGTFQHPNAMWRAIESPALVWVSLCVIVIFEILGAVLCWMGTVKMWQGRNSTEAFKAAKEKAMLGLGVTACLYFIGFLVIAQEFFLMWQNSQLNVLPDAFRIFATAMLIGLWLAQDD